MKKIVGLLLLFTGMVNAQIVNIPDAAFKARLLSASNDLNQSQFLIAQDNNNSWVVIDTNNDGEIQVSEALAIRFLNVSGIGISDLTGLEAFSNLFSLSVGTVPVTSLDLNAMTQLKFLALNNLFQLSSLNMNSLTDLDQLQLISLPNLSSVNMSNLNQLESLFVYSTNLTSLNLNAPATLTQLTVMGNPQLASLNLSGYGLLQRINCSMNALNTLTLIGVTQLTELNCSSNRLTNLNGISPTITKLNFSNNLLTNINFNGLVNLEELVCSYNQLSSLDVSNLSNLKLLDCSYLDITSLNINNLPSLITLNCSNNYLLTTATFADLPSLEDLRVFGGISSNSSILSQLTSLTFSNLPQLKKLFCNYGMLSTLNLSGLDQLEELDCSWNQIVNLNLTNLPNLKKLTCTNNMMTDLDASQLPNLTDLSCGGGYIVDGQIIPKLQTLNVVGLSNLINLNCSVNLLTSLNLSGLMHLESLICSGMPGAFGNITSIDVAGLSQLKSLDCSYQQLTSLDVSNLANLTDLSCAHNLISSLNLNGLINLRTLNYDYNQLANLSLINLPSLVNLTCSNNQLTTLNVQNLTQLENLNCAFNQLTALNLTGLNSLKYLDYSSNQLALSNVSGLSTQLVSLNCSQNNLSSLDLTGLSGLVYLYCDYNQISALEVSHLTQLQYLDFSNNSIATIDLAPLTNLVSLDAGSNLLTSIDVTALVNLASLNCSLNQLSSLDVSQNTLLNVLDYSFNSLPTVDLSQLVNLTMLSCINTQTAQLQLGNLAFLNNLSCGSNQLTTLDVSQCRFLNSLYCGSNQLTTLFLKNGYREAYVDFSNNPNLQYICADDSQLESIQTQLNSLGMNATVSNSYCTFSPGGNHNTITGIAIYDDNNDGCDVTDEVNPFVRFNITDGTQTGATVTNLDGTYKFYVNAGNYTVAPNVENPSWYDFSPASANISFPNNNNNLAPQHFCINAVGVHGDIEVVFHQTEVARPGFDSTYKIVYKNKGNQMHSGTVTLTFDDSRTDFLSALPTADATNNGLITWNYENLMPFESRSIELVFNTNSPTETPPVNNGDVLDFTASITPVIADELPQDNTFDYHQLVVGSFDPNDISCVEGATVDASYIGKYLHYVVNFENTGTYFAQNIVVRTDIDPTKYDVNTLQVMSSSHPSYTRIEGNRVEFVFQNIELDPAQGDPPVGGHGDILFKIKTKADLVPQDAVLQRAGIYFDYNFPIITNDAITTFSTLSQSFFEKDNSISIAPNPTSSEVNISSKYHLKSVELYDLQGRILVTFLGNTKLLDISDQASGVYFLKIITEKGAAIEKIIKE